MSMVAIIPIANILSANDLLNNVAQTPGKKSHGPNNFSVPAYTGAAVTHGALHSWSDPVFEADVKAIPNVVWEISEGDPVTRTQALIAGLSKWINYDAVDDVLNSTFQSSLGSSCTVARANVGASPTILTSQTIGTSYADSTDHAGLIIINRAFTGQETTDVTAWLKGAT